MYVSLGNHLTYRFNPSLKLEVKLYFTVFYKGLKCMYLSIIIRDTLIPSLNRSKFFVLRYFHSLSLNKI
jgi:hypothetical protein